MASELFPWERQAANGDPIPEGLSVVEQAAYTSLRNVYRLFNAHYIDREHAAEEKRIIFAEFQKESANMEFLQKLTDKFNAIVKATESAQEACYKNPCVDTLNGLLVALNGVGLDGAAKRGEERNGKD